MCGYDKGGKQDNEGDYERKRQPRGQSSEGWVSNQRKIKLQVNVSFRDARVCLIRGQLQFGIFRFSPNWGEGGWGQNGFED